MTQIHYWGEHHHWQGTKEDFLTLEAFDTKCVPCPNHCKLYEDHLARGAWHFCPVVDKDIQT